MKPWIFIILLIVHYLGDYIFQARKDANLKHESLLHMLNHIVTYSSIVIIIFTICCFCDGYCNITGYILFISLNCFSHFVIDFITSNFNYQMWKSQREKLFWCGIGFDQLLHITILYLTFIWLLQ